MKEVCHDVTIEPNLQPLLGETFDNNSTTCEDEARLDIKANWLRESRFTSTFLDVNIFNPHAESCPYKDKSLQISRVYQKEQIRATHFEWQKSAFCPLVYSCTGGAGATKAMKRLAGLISEKRQESYADVVMYIRKKISFALLRSSILCIRSLRSLKEKGSKDLKRFLLLLKKGSWLLTCNTILCLALRYGYHMISNLWTLNHY